MLRYRVKRSRAGYDVDDGLFESLPRRRALCEEEEETLHSNIGCAEITSLYDTISISVC
jgi:hypothetical protein